MLGSLFKDRNLEMTEAYYQARRAFEVDPSQDFIRVKNRIGLIGSMVYAQMYFASQTRYKRFRREIELHQNQRNGLNKDFDVLIVTPPRGIMSQEAIQRMLRQTMGLATSAGFSYVSQAQLNTDRVLHGAKRLHKLVQEKQNVGRKLIIVSHSYGSSFVRVLLDQSPSEDLFHIKGWVNFSGLIFGSPLYDCSDRTRIIPNTSPSQRTFSCEQRYFRGLPQLNGIKSVHFLGMQINEEVSRGDRKRMEKLKAWGPNDGLINYAPYQKFGETVVPMLDQGHIFDLSRLSTTFIRTLSAIVSTLPQEKVERLKSDLDFL